MLVVGKSDIGRVRMVNEDRFVTFNHPDGFVIAIVADGMGGHQAGDVASQMTIEIVQEQLSTLSKELTIMEIENKLELAIFEANEKVFQVANRREHYHGMGTTIVVLIATTENIIIGHIGDSRLYRISSGGIVQITEDHTYVNELVKTGQITSEQAITHPRRNVLLRALGTDIRVECDIRSLDWQQGDQLIICSDGLSNMLSMDQMLQIMESKQPLAQKVEVLIEQALAAGGDDNITVVLVKNEHADFEERGD